MIVSGFTQRMTQPTDEEMTEFPGCHTHCVRCRQAYCKHPIDNVTACGMTRCQGCGFRFHECKAEEHTLTCQQERVPCINAIYGCPHQVKRSNLSTHLPVCPASVVSCGEEWCRWPMYTKEKGKHPLPPTKTYIDCGQLDVGLAMRDQRMLIDSLRAPAKLKRTLRNPLTQKYPAAPIAHRSPSSDSTDLIASCDTSQTVSDDDTDAPWDPSRRQPGLRESISSHLVSVSREAKEDLISALNSGKISSHSSSSPSQKQGSLSPLANITEETDEIASNLVQCPITKQAQHRESSEEKERSSLSPMRSVRSSVSSERDRERTRSRSVSVLHDVGGSQLHKILGVKLGGDSGDDDISLHKILGVSLTHDVINKYVGKPASMYTFICAQHFRRDQYKWHFKNVHEEISSQLDGFLEQRCPLANAGCTFSFQRMVPSQPDTVLHFSWLQESFGLKSTAQPFPSSCQNIDEDKLQGSKYNSPPQAENSSDKECHGPSISDLANIDRDFDQLVVNVDDGIIDFKGDNKGVSSSSPTSFTAIRKQETRDGEDGMPNPPTKTKTSVQPVVYTAHNPNSKVLLVYNVEEEEECEQSVSSYDLTGLPFEVLQQIARRLDSFSLCNLSLTCRILRDVCCTLLDDLGIVTLNWERQKIGDKISWNVANKRWIFSTSFEPIKSWKFNENRVTISDHLKVCPFNQDKLTHSVPLPIVL